MNQLATPKKVCLEYSDQDLNFSAGHFTIFAHDQRERLHGHNYLVQATLTLLVGNDGLNFDCRLYKDEIYQLCQQLHLAFLLPTQSPYLQIEDEGEYVNAYFNNERIPFLKKDVILLPLTNISIEELAHWFLVKLTDDKHRLDNHSIIEISVKISSYPGIAATAKWSLHDD